MLRRLSRALALVTLTASCGHALIYRPVLNVQTGRPDLITPLSTDTIKAGTNITVSSNTDGSVTITSLGGGGASSLEVMANGVQLSSPTKTLSILPGTNVTLSATNVGGTTAQITINATGGGGGGYALEPSTVTPRFDRGMTASTGTFTSSVTIQGSGGLGVTYGVVAGSVTANDLTDSQMVRTDANKKLISSATLTVTELVGVLPAAQVGDLSATYLTNSSATATYQNKGAYLTANQNITVSGDSSGSGTTAITLTANPVQANIKTVTSSATFTNQVLFDGVVTSTAPVQIATNTILGPTTFYNDGRSVGIKLGVSAYNNGTGADATTFLRGDGTWVTPTASAAPDGISFNVQIASAGATKGVAGFNVNRDSISISNAYYVSASTAVFDSSVTVTNIGNVTINNASFNASSGTFNGNLTSNFQITGGSLTLNAIANPATPNAGTIWNSTTYQAFVSSINAVLQNIPTTLFTIDADSNTNTTATQVSWWGSGDTTGAPADATGITLPANFWTVGKTMYIVMVGTQTRTGTPTIRADISLGSTVIISTTASTLGTYTAVSGNRFWKLEAELKCVRAGASGLINGSGRLWFGGSTTAFTEFALTQSNTTIDTTVVQSLQFHTTWGTSNAANSLTLLGGQVTVHY